MLKHVLLVLAALCVGAALAGSASAAVAAPSAVARPSATRDCGDIRAASWSFRQDTHSITGSHYSVRASNLACATARSLAAKMTYKKLPMTYEPSPGGFDRKLLLGYSCLVMVPPGFQLSRGRCFPGTNLALLQLQISRMDPKMKSFSWTACVAVPARHEHMLCTVRRT